MQASSVVCLHAPSKPYGGVALSPVGADQVQFNCPSELAEGAFPVAESVFNVERVIPDASAGALESYANGEMASDIVNRFPQRSNTVVFAYGERGTPKRQFMLGTTAAGGRKGYAGEIITSVFQKNVPGTYTLCCYAIGNTENLTDLLDLSNTEGIIAESVKEGPRARNITKQKLASPADVNGCFAKIVQNYEQTFAKVLPEVLGTPEEQAFPPYNCTSIVCVLSRFESGNTEVEANSLHFIALSDSERPVLCGIDVQQLSDYEKTHKTLSSVASVMGSIKCNRLRIPFGKSKMTSLLKRACNAEKNNPHNDLNQPTKCYLLTHVFNDHGHAEESFHALTMVKRLLSVMGGGGIGPATRDLAVEKWRLEQDIIELKDELTIAKAVHDYKPCIYDQAKPVQNIQEEEQKRIAVIQKRREDAKERAQAEIRAKAREEALLIIEEQEKQSNRNLKELEKRLAEMRQENQTLQAERSKKASEYEKQLDKIRKKKEGEEALVEKLREEIAALEEDLKSRQEAVEKKRKQLEVSSLDQAKGREAILKEREAIKQQRAKLYAERKAQREQWLAQIKETNEKVLAQVIQLSKDRAHKKETDGNFDDDDGEENEAAVRADIESINKYLPKLISLDDVPADLEATESIRRQLEEYFVQEKEAYTAKLEVEKERKAKLEKAVEVYKGRLSEQQSKQKQEHMAEAMRKDSHLAMLSDSVIQFLQGGLRMTKISSKGNIRRRFFFLSDDCKRIHACEVDSAGMPINRKRPSVTIWIKDVKRVILGCYTPSFMSFAGPKLAEKARDEAMRDDGSYTSDPTPTLTPANLGRWNYRSFAFILRGGKTLEVVCDTDSDCEAWIMALRRILQYKTPHEKEVERRGNVQATECLADIGWGQPLRISNRIGFDKLQLEESQFCGDNHIPPQLYLNVKKELEEKSQNSIVTVYDVRVSSTLDLLRSQLLHEFLVDQRIIPGVN